jgi:hypothetical protein
MKKSFVAISLVMAGMASAAWAQTVIKEGHVYSSKCVVDYMVSKGCRECGGYSCRNSFPYFGDINKQYTCMVGSKVNYNADLSNALKILAEAETSCANK